MLPTQRNNKIKLPALYGVAQNETHVYMKPTQLVPVTTPLQLEL